MPSFSRMPARKSAAFRVSPGGFEVSMATYSERSLVTSSGLAVGWGAAAEDTKLTKDTEDSTNSVRSRRLMFSPVSFVCVGGLDTLLRRFEGSGGAILSDPIPVEASAVHRDIDAGGQRLHERERA